MARFLFSAYSFCVRKWDKFILAFSWVLGLMVGGIMFRYGGGNLVSVMPLAARSQPSIFGLLACALFPLLLCAYAVYIGIPLLLYGICFLKAVAFAYLSQAVFTAFGNAGWLLRWLLLFTDTFAAAALYHYCHRHISGVRKWTIRHFSAYAGFVAVVSMVDHRVVSTLLMRVLG